MTVIAFCYFRNLWCVLLQCFVLTERSKVLKNVQIEAKNEVTQYIFCLFIQRTKLKKRSKQVFTAFAFCKVYACQCDQIDFFQTPSILAQNVKKRQGQFSASIRNDRICDKQKSPIFEWVTYTVHVGYSDWTPPRGLWSLYVDSAVAIYVM